MSHLGTTDGRSYQKSDLPIVRDALNERLGDDDLAYVKARQLAEDTGLTSKAAGKHLATLREEENEFEFEPWNDSKSNRMWVVTRNED